MSFFKSKYGVIFIFVLIFGAIQFVRPNKNTGMPYTNNDLLQANAHTPEVAELLKSSCYDCHSNQTQTYWYSNIAPAAWLVDKNVKEGREKLNFSDWESYSFEERVNFAGLIMFQMYEGKMPVEEYVWMHKEADLTKAQQNKITEWINTLVE